MRQGRVYYNDVLAGIITEDENGYSFVYDGAYLASDGALPVSLTLPLKQEPFRQNVLFSFFDGLIPEGWMLNIAERNWKINRRDRMALLLTATGISNQVAERILNRFIGLPSKWFACIDDSFISDDQKARFKSLIQQRIDVLEKT